MAFSFKKKQKNKPKATASAKLSLRSAPVGKNKNLNTGILSRLTSFLNALGPRYALIIGDEGAIVIYMVDRQVQSRNFIANASVDNLKEFETILAKNKNAPVYLIVDSMDQSFVQQSLPPISSLGVKKLIKRRLERDLGANVIKGYVLLERDSTGRLDWNFLMVSLENSPRLNLWFEFIEKIDNRLQGIYLLSVETENIVKSLDEAMGIPKKDKKNPEGSQWKFFVTHNKIGGFRQVILKDGRIIFTRLTQPVGEVTPEVIAGNIEQEMASTVEYMKRLSFTPQKGLDIYIIASSEINSYLDLSRIPSQNIYKFTPFEVSEFLGITGAAQVSDQFGDVILTSFIASSKKHRLTLFLPSASKVNAVYKIIKFQRALVSLVVLGIIAYGGVIGIGLLQKYSEIEDLSQKKIAQQRKYDDLNNEISKNGIDIKTIDDTVALYKKLGDEAQSPLAVLARVRPAITPSVTIREISWEAVDGSKATPPVANNTGEKLDTISVVLRFPEISNTEEAFNVLAKKVMTDVREAFPEYKVVYSKLPDVLNKKSEAGAISFDDTKNVQIDKANLEATLSLTKLTQAEVPSALPPGMPNIQGILPRPGMPGTDPALMRQP